MDLKNIPHPYISNEHRLKHEATIKNIQENIHHILAKEKGGNNKPDNKIKLFVHIHDAIHRIFGNEDLVSKIEKLLAKEHTAHSATTEKSFTINSGNLRGSSSENIYQWNTNTYFIANIIFSMETKPKEQIILEAKLETIQYEYEKLQSVYLDFVERSKDDALKLNHSVTLINKNLSDTLAIMNKLVTNLIEKQQQCCKTQEQSPALSDAQINELFDKAK